MIDSADADKAYDRMQRADALLSAYRRYLQSRDMRRMDAEDLLSEYLAVLATDEEEGQE